MKKWFKRMFLDLLFDEEVRREILEALDYEKQRRPPPPKPSKYKRAASS